MFRYFRAGIFSNQGLIKKNRTDNEMNKVKNLFRPHSSKDFLQRLEEESQQQETSNGRSQDDVMDARAVTGADKLNFN